MLVIWVSGLAVSERLDKGIRKGGEKKITKKKGNIKKTDFFVMYKLYLSQKGLTRESERVVEIKFKKKQTKELDD